MLLLLLSWFIISVVALSLGNVLVSVLTFFDKAKHQISFFDTFFLGLGVIAVLLLVLSLFAPINIPVLGAFTLFSLLYWGINWRKVVVAYREGRKKIVELETGYRIAFLLLFLSIIFYGLTTPLLYDEGLYHLQTMKWAEEYKTVVGLGNLHGRLAFNSSFLLLSTLFNYHSSSFPVFFSINSLCLFLFSSWLLLRIRQTDGFITKIGLLFLSLILLFFFGTYLSSTSTDILPNILVVYILFSLILCKDISLTKIFVLSILSLFCVTLKLSSAPICLVAIYAIFEFAKLKKLRKLFLLIGVGTVIFIPWIVRFVMLSGYLIYPFPAIDVFSFDFKIPIEEVIAEKNAAYAWPRIPEANVNEVLAMPFYEWIPVWIKNQSLFVLSLYFLAIISPIVILLNNRAFKENRTFIIAWAIAFIGFFVGFFTAPDPRFGIGFTLCSGLLPFVVLSSKRVDAMTHKVQQVLPTILIVGLCWLTYSAFRQVSHYQNEPMVTLLYKPQPINYKKDGAERTFGAFPKGKTTIYYPNESNQCFDLCFPCMPYFDNRIEMRGNEIDAGFRKITK